MKFPGNWVKCAYTQKHCFLLCCNVVVVVVFFFIKCSFFSLFLNLHDMSGAYTLGVRYFQLNYSAAKKLYKFLASCSSSSSFRPTTKSQMSCLIKRIKSHGTTRHLALRFLLRSSQKRLWYKTTWDDALWNSLRCFALFVRWVELLITSRDGHISWNHMVD